MEESLSAKERIFFWSSIYAMLISWLFAYAYCEYNKSCAREMGISDLSTELVGTIVIFAYIAPYAFLVPLLSVICFEKTRKSDPQRRTVICAYLTAAGWLFSLAWPLLSVIIWKLPYIVFMVPM